MSDADFSQMNPGDNVGNLGEWATNKRETFPGASEKQPDPLDSDSEFEDET